MDATPAASSRAAGVLERDQLAQRKPVLRLMFDGFTAP